MLSNLKPYQPYLYTPSRKPLEVGDLVVLLASPRGYCAQIVDIQRFSVSVRLLDAEPSIDSLLTYGRNELIQTGKKARIFTHQYEPNSIDFDNSLDLERGLPDFNKFKVKKKGPGKIVLKTKKEPKKLTEFQKKQIGDMLRARLKELKGDQK